VARRAWSVAGRADREPVLPAALAAPDTPLNGAISARRAVSLGSISLDELQTLKRRFGVKLNDVVLGLCTGALRRYLGERGALPREPLVAAIPVSLAPDASPRRTDGNRVSAMTVELPVQLDDPFGRLAHIHREMLRAKRAHRDVGGDLLSGWAEVAPPLVLSGLSEAYSRLDLADRHRPVVNLIVSNVPGPPLDLYCAGHRVHACCPLGPIYEGCSLNLTVMSYGGRLHFGWVACPDVVPDVARIGEALSEAVTELRGLGRPRGRRSRRRAPGAGPASERRRNAARRRATSSE
jgi:WS/DGAT/MGAT family acyltransferase